MELHLVWKVLGIEETKDVDVIRQAYHEKLKYVNPEDDQAGFMQLRQAYETAMDFATRVEQAPLSDEYEQLKDGTEIDRFIYRMNLLYEDIGTRIDEAEWSSLLDSYDDDDLDGELQERVLVYIMNHHHFPRAIWVKLDEKFHFYAETEMLKEKFPENFLGYINYYIKHDSFIDYDLFEGETGHNADEYINRYLDLKNKLEQAEDFSDANLVSQIFHEFELLDEFDLYHPFIDAEKLHFFLCIQKENESLPQEALEIADRLSSDYPDNFYIGYFCGVTFLAFDKDVIAKQIFDELMKADPDSYLAKLGMLRTLKKLGEYAQAKEHCLDLLDTEDRNPELNDILEELNETLVPIYQGKMEADPEDTENIIELGWCYFQQQKFEKVEEILKSVAQDKFERYDFLNLMGRNYLAMDQYEQALPYLISWRQIIDETTDDGTKESKKRLNRKGFAHFAVGLCHYQTGQKDLGKEEINEGISFETSEQFKMSYYDQLVQCYLTDKEYQMAYDLCTELIEKDENFFPAFVRRQEAAFELHKGQAVIDDFYNCKRIYPGYIRPYIYAMKVFSSARQYEDTLNIYEQAMEVGLYSDELQLLYFKAKRCNCKNIEDLRPLIVEFHQFKTKCMQKLDAASKADTKESGGSEQTNSAENDTDLEDAVELYAEDFLFRLDLKDIETANETIQEALKKYPDNIRLLELRGDFLWDHNQFERAFACFQRLMDLGSKNADTYMMMGKYYNKKSHNTYDENTEKALSFFNKVYEEFPQHQECLYYLSRIFRRKYHYLTASKEKNDAYEVSLFYAEKLCEIERNAFNLIELGLVYEVGYQYEKALSLYQNAAELEPDNIYAHNNAGNVYLKLKKYDEAEKELLKSIEFETDEEPTMVYEYLVDLYEIKENYPLAIKYALLQLKRFPKDQERILQLIGLYEKVGRYQDAISEYQKLFEYDFIKKYEMCYHIAKYYYWDGKKLKALKMYQEALSLVRTDSEAKQEVIASKSEWNKRPAAASDDKK